MSPPRGFFYFCPVSLPSQHQTGILEAGLDEAGRGCLAGPVVAAAVILPEGFTHPVLTDSKKLNEKKRNQLRSVVKAEALAWGVGVVSPERIDEINILNASFEAMRLAVAQLKPQPEALLVDGNRFRPAEMTIPYTCMIKGDSRFLNIAAASILAKTRRDELMVELGLKYPAYNWSRNKGYPTAEHRAAIVANGPTPWHRMSFTLYPPKTLF